MGNIEVDMKEIIDSSGGALKKKDIIEYTSAAGRKLLGVICPKCGRRRAPDMVVIIPCPGPYNPKTGRSEGRCNDMSFMREEIKKDYDTPSTYVPKKKSEKGGDEMNKEKKEALVTKLRKEIRKPTKKVSTKKSKAPLKGKKVPAGSKQSISDQVLALVKKNKSRKEIIEITGANPNTVGSLMYSARKKLGVK